MPPSVNQRATAWEDRHTLAMLALTLAAVALLAAGVAVPPAAQVAVLAAAVAGLGLPHGAFDAVIGEDLFRSRLGRWWGVWFSAGYLGLAAAVVGLWIIAPPVALASFFAAAAWHFGTTDARRTDAPSGWAWAIEAAARGAMPIAVPAAFHPVAVAQLVSCTMPGDHPWLTPAAVSDAGWAALAAIGPPLLAAAIWHAAAAGRSRGSVARRHALTAAELPTLAALFALAPPLVGFVVYFCGWHSMRHELHLVGRVNPADPAAGLRTVLLRALPATLTTVALAAAAFAWLTRAGSPTAGAAVQVVFVGLSALTVPHMLLEVVAERRHPARPKKRASFV